MVLAITFSLSIYIYRNSRNITLWVPLKYVALHISFVSILYRKHIYQWHDKNVPLNVTFKREQFLMWHMHTLGRKEDKSTLWSLDKEALPACHAAIQITSSWTSYKKELTSLGHEQFYRLLLQPNGKYQRQVPLFCIQLHCYDCWSCSFDTSLFLLLLTPAFSLAI